MQALLQNAAKTQTLEFHDYALLDSLLDVDRIATFCYQRTVKKLLLLFVVQFTIGVAAYGEPGVAIAIVYDKSGNKVQAGIVCFPGSSNGANAVSFATWNPEPFRKWLAGFNTPSGGTPLGDAILTASKLVADSPLAKKHVVVLTDGESNQGISPDEGVRSGMNYKKKEGAISYYFVAFDTSAAQFSDLKKKGAIVLSASNETELQKGLTNIFTQKILLEEEEK